MMQAAVARLASRSNKCLHGRKRSGSDPGGGRLGGPSIVFGRPALLSTVKGYAGQGAGKQLDGNETMRQSYLARASSLCGERRGCPMRRQKARALSCNCTEYCTWTARYRHATVTRRKAWAGLFHGLGETAKSSSTTALYIHTQYCVGFNKIARSAACLVSNSQARTARPYPNRLRISQSARGDPEGGCRTAGRLVLAASLIGPSNGRSNGSDCRRNTKGGPPGRLASYFPGSEMKTHFTATAPSSCLCRSE